MKPKEPLLAIFYSFVFPGLGQLYSGKSKRGFAIFGIYSAIFIATISFLLYFVNPQTKITVFSLILFSIFAILAYIFGIFVAIDAYRCSRAFNKEHNFERKSTLVKIVLLVIGIIFFDVFLSFDIPIRNYIKENVVQAYKFPSGSMEPTILKDDQLLADKAIYKKAKPQRGDLIVFKYPQDPSKDFVKRVIALGGETVEIKNGRIYIDGQLSSDRRIKDRYYYNKGDYGQEGKSVTVPQDCYYVLGDYSVSSHDSRYWGFVPEKLINAKVYKIFWPLNRSGAVE